MNTISQSKKKRIESKFEPDGYYKNEKEIILFEFYSHIGELKDGQTKKICKDLLKLITLEKVLIDNGEKRKIRKIFVVIEEIIKDKLYSGENWLSETVKKFNFEIVVMELESEMEEKLIETQKKQDITEK